jgi:hypothetical protein
MRKVAVIIFCFSLCFTITANAFDLIAVQPDDSFLKGLSTNIEADKDYLKSIAKQYSNEYIVTEELYSNITDIDDFFSNLSKPLSLAELDAGKAEFPFEIIEDDDLRKAYTIFNVLGGHGGYSAGFEPVIYFNIHRNITLVGGYVQYKKTHDDLYAAYWQYVCEVQNLTKEIIPYDTRLMLIEHFKHLDRFINGDNKFKIFLLIDGKIDSIYERGDIF